MLDDGAQASSKRKCILVLIALRESLGSCSETNKDTVAETVVLNSVHFAAKV